MNPGQPSFMKLNHQEKVGWGIKMKTLTRVSVRAGKMEKVICLGLAFLTLRTSMWLWGPLQNENVGTPDEKLRISRWQHRALNQAWGHSKHRTMCECHMPRKLVLWHLQPQSISTTLCTLSGNESYLFIPRSPVLLSTVPAPLLFSVSV